MIEDAFQLVGTTVAGVFRVDAVVAEGGFGVVYQAYHSGFDAKVALKCLKIPQGMDENKRGHFREQFKAEAQLLFRLSASLPNVVRPLHVDAITSPNGRFMPFMALEWLEGETLDAFSAREGAVRPLRRVIEILTPAAEVLEQAHHFMTDDGPVSIIHRDIKPENLFLANVAGKRVVKVLDFGIGKAKAVASQVVGRTSVDASGLSSFTPAYGAPEQWAPKRYGQTGPWTDVFGLALTAVELFAGQPALNGDAAALVAAALDVHSRPTPGAHGVSVPAAVERVFEKALAVDPRERFQSVREFWDALSLADASSPASSAVTLLDTQELAADTLISRAEANPPDNHLGRSLQLASAPPRPPRHAVGERDEVELQLDLDAGDDNPLRQGDAGPELVLDYVDHSAVELPAVQVRARARARDYAVPLAALAAGALLVLLGRHHAAVSGRVFSLGSIGLSWFTIPLLVLGTLGVAAQLLRGRSSLDR